MKIYVSVDGGTTNTRVALVKDGKILNSKKIPIGSKACIDGTAPLKAAIKASLCQILSEEKISESEITAIIASGMITCEYGLCELPHIQAPAGLCELHRGMKKLSIDEISSVPFYFIPGVKLIGKDFYDSDIIRGEETEIMGLLKNDPDCVYVLPGSHNKLIEIDKELRICRFETLLTGEMIAALAQNTILKASVDLGVSEYDCEYLIKGYETAVACGVNTALFKTRILGNLFGGSKEQTYGYFLGVVLANEVESLKKSNKSTIVIGGKSVLKNALAHILRQVTSLDVVCDTDAEVDESVALGQIRVYEYAD